MRAQTAAFSFLVALGDSGCQSWKLLNAFPQEIMGIKFIDNKH